MEWLADDRIFELVQNTSRHFTRRCMVRFSRGFKGAFLGNGMTKLLTIMASALLGLMTCFAAIWISNASQLAAHFPSPGGEDDFSVRTSYFLLGVCPALTMLGAWIGRRGFGNARKWVASWSGAWAGAFVVFAATAALQSRLDRLTSDQMANQAVFWFYAAWVAASWAGAWLTGRAHRQRNQLAT